MEGRNNKGQFTKGHNFAKGRPKKPEIEELRKAIKQVEQEKKEKLLVHFIRRAFKNDNVMVAAIKKLIADKTQAEVDLGGEIKAILVIDKLNENKKSEPASVPGKGAKE